MQDNHVPGVWFLGRLSSTFNVDSNEQNGANKPHDNCKDYLNHAAVDQRVQFEVFQPLWYEIHYFNFFFLYYDFF